MNWFEYTEQKRKLLIGGTVIICLAMLIVTVRRNVFSYDGYWHLKAGLDWLDHGLSLWQDHYSFTFNGEEISSPPYIFQVSLGWLVNRFGLEPGFQIYRFVNFLFLFGLFVAFLRRLRVPALVYCLVLPMVVVLFQLRTLTRPELVSYSFIVLAMMLYYRTRNQLSAAGVLPMIGLILLWSNYHSPIFGYIIFFGYFVDIALKQLRNGASVRIWLQWLGWGIAIVAVGFLTPGFQHSLMGVLSFAPEWKELIAEYQSALVVYGQVAVFYALIAITLITLVLLLWKRQFGLLIVCVILTYNSALMARLVAPSGLIILCAFAWMMSDVNLKNLLRSLPALPRNVIGGIALVIFVLSLGTGVNRARGFMEENKSSAIRYPSDVVDYMIDHDISGRIFNAYEAGGYLIYRLSPDSQVYIDGRTSILYSFAHYKRFLDASKSPDVLHSEIEKFDINLALMANSLHHFSLLNDSNTLGLDFVGAKFSLFRKNQPNFPLLGTLITQPACWSEDLSAALEAEQARANSILPDYSTLLPFMDSVMEYTHAGDKTAYLDSLDEWDKWTDSKRRFMGYQALSHGLYLMAFKLLGGFDYWMFKDFLAGALAKVHLGEWKTAEQLLNRATRINWIYMNYYDLVILHGLLEHIRQNASLELFDDAYVDRLAVQVAAPGDSDSSSIPDIRSFCSGSSIVIAED